MKGACVTHIAITVKDRAALVAYELLLIERALPDGSADETLYDLATERAISTRETNVLPFDAPDTSRPCRVRVYGIAPDGKRQLLDVQDIEFTDEEAA